MNEKHNPFALDTLNFISKKTTDSNPFGDASLVQSNVASAMPTLSRHVPVTHDEKLRRAALKLINDTVDQNSLAQQSVQQSDASPPVYTDMQLIVDVRRRMLEPGANRDNFINVLLFWIRLQVSDGMPNHGKVVVNVLDDMKILFVAKHAPKREVLAQLDAVIKTQISNVDNTDFDSTESIVQFVNIVGVYFMFDYLLLRRVVVNDPTAFDTLSAWLSFKYVINKPVCISGADEQMSDQLLKCMQSIEKRVNVPHVP